MNEEEYLTQRLEDQMGYYDKKSQKNQSYYKRTKAIEVLSAGLIPLLAGNIDSLPYVHWLIGLLGLLIAVCEAMESLNKYQENWLLSRAVAQALSKEKFLFLTKAGPYSHKSAFRQFVAQVESTLADENNQWVANMQQDNHGNSDKEKSS
ncbi:DUF4231 domain-containing protein [Colwellia psychrerythraea]|uniref:DUF4231 domain-containing protein n=1 Tax=Colwellia psychrerythraea TaxID=28229 RepID=A0A099KD35_COLPS|nr:DUF4231 domain-containing protein [Colwellia psychrerythraea]KGJ87952.1 Protein of unknown function DUF4231 [Colwellia psychrerythraea]